VIAAQAGGASPLVPAPLVPEPVPVELDVLPVWCWLPLPAPDDSPVLPDVDPPVPESVLKAA